jgi:hypothetical protein
MEIVRSLSVAPVIAALPKLQQQIFKDVREAFVQQTGAGEFYMSDEDDLIVMQPFAALYSLSVEEIAIHYSGAECMIAQFQETQLGSSPPADFEKWAMKKGNTVVSRYDEEQKCILVSINGCRTVAYRDLPVSSFSELFRSYTFSPMFK